MPRELPDECRELLAEQASVIARSQGTATGLSVQTMRNRLRYGDWQALQRGVYSAFTGEASREARLWAALLRAGPDAVLSHHTAAERHGLLNAPSPAIHITVPVNCNPARYGKIPEVVIHRSASVASKRHPVMVPPCTRIEETVLDLIKIAGGFDEAYDWVCRAIGRRRTTAERLRTALAARERFPWRRDLELALSGAGEGVLSWLELRYARGVERPHQLPIAQRQARVFQEGGSRYLDNLYAHYRVCVELDGTAAHPRDQQWRDKRRDNWNLVQEKIVTLRFGFLDLRDQQSRCATAAAVASLLADRGPAVGTPCGSSGCPVPLRCVVHGE